MSGAQSRSRAKVILYAYRRLGFSYRYRAELESQIIVENSFDPEPDIARALIARGLTGIALIVDGRTGALRTRISIEKASRLRTGEEDHRGLRTRKWTPGGSATPQDDLPASDDHEVTKILSDRCRGPRPGAPR